VAGGIHEMLQPNIAEGPGTTASRGASVERVASFIRGQLPCCKEDSAISIASFRAADIVVPLSLSPITSRHSSFKSGLVIKALSSRPYSTSPELERQHRILLPTRPPLTNRSQNGVSTHSIPSHAISCEASGGIGLPGLFVPSRTGP
jgi:hypothetical protein